LETEHESSTSLEMSKPNLQEYVYSDSGSSVSNPTSSEAWSEYADLLMQLSASIPLQEMTLAYLDQLAIGTILCSTWAAFEDLPLCVNDTFLANVCFEPAGANLAARISDFVPRSLQTGRNIPAVHTSNTFSKQQDILNAIRITTFLRFGVATVALTDITRLAVGHIVVLDRAINANVDVVARGYVVASGALVLVGGCYAVQISKTTHAIKEFPFC